eukprot:scaffold10176_cov179-Ochromonas_danica.AAC.1
MKSRGIQLQHMICRWSTSNATTAIAYLLSGLIASLTSRPVSVSHSPAQVEEGGGDRFNGCTSIRTFTWKCCINTQSMVLSVPAPPAAKVNPHAMLLPRVTIASS